MLGRVFTSFRMTGRRFRMARKAGSGFFASFRMTGKAGSGFFAPL